MSTRASASSALDPLDELLSPPDLVHESNRTLNERTLERWRTRGVGPRFVKLGRRVAYRRRDWLAWLDSQTCQHTAEKRTA